MMCTCMHKSSENGGCTAWCACAAACMMEALGVCCVLNDTCIRELHVCIEDSHIVCVWNRSLHSPPSYNLNS